MVEFLKNKKRLVANVFMGVGLLCLAYFLKDASEAEQLRGSMFAAVALLLRFSGCQLNACRNTDLKN